MVASRVPGEVGGCGSRFFLSSSLLCPGPEHILKELCIGYAGDNKPLIRHCLPPKPQFPHYLLRGSQGAGGGEVVLKHPGRVALLQAQPLAGPRPRGAGRGREIRGPRPGPAPEGAPAAPGAAPDAASIPGR